MHAVQYKKKKKKKNLTIAGKRIFLPFLHHFVDAPCTGITATGSSVAEMLVILHDHLCGCMYIEGNINIAIYTTFPDFNEPLKESDFSFFYHLREISQYLYLQYIPSMEQLSLPNLRIIRGESLFSGLALATYNCRITTLYMPQLKEITRGNIFFRENIKFPSVCNVLNINWTDILSMDSSTVKILLPNCTDASKCLIISNQVFHFYFLLPHH